MTTPARRSRTVHETITAAPMIVVPKGRSAAERRLAALAALHQPIERVEDGRGIMADRVFYVCSECKGPDRYGSGCASVLWPCTTVKLLGPWPGEPVE